jgi:hypothetical protein
MTHPGMYKRGFKWCTRCRKWYKTDNKYCEGCIGFGKPQQLRVKLRFAK